MHRHGVAAGDPSPEEIERQLAGRLRRLQIRCTLEKSGATPQRSS
jgi:hypothetical protein